MVQAFKRVREWVDASGIAIEAYEPSVDVMTDAQIVEWIRDNGSLIYHPTSSCEWSYPCALLLALTPSTSFLPFPLPSCIHHHYDSSKCPPSPLLHPSQDTARRFALKSRHKTHHLPTGAMGPSSNPSAVLDPHARVRGVTGLRVVDASAFPFCPPGHPMATVCKYTTFFPSCLIQYPASECQCPCTKREGERERMCNVLTRLGGVQICWRKRLRIIYRGGSRC